MLRTQNQTPQNVRRKLNTKGKISVMYCTCRTFSSKWQTRNSGNAKQKSSVVAGGNYVAWKQVLVPCRFLSVIELESQNGFFWKGL